MSGPTPAPGERAPERDDAGIRESVRRFAHPLVLAGLALTAAISLVGRFFVNTPLWLDEALSVNIARLPIGEISEALRQDGHPPLYYLLLHVWMEAFGEGDRAVRSLSGLLTVVGVALAYLCGRRLGSTRLGVTAALVFAVSPFAFRFASETRMYSLVMVLVMVGYLLVSSALDNPRPAMLGGVAVTTSALMWTHYWTFWLLGSVGILLIAQARQSVAARKVLAAMAVGALTFIPWVPTLLYQSEHTGTPWAPGFRPTSLVVTSVLEFAGGSFSEPQIGMMLSIVLLVLGIFGKGLTNSTVELDARPRQAARVPLALMILTMVIASAAGIATGMAFSPRYASVFFPFFVLLVALGINQLHGGTARNVVLTVFAMTALAGIFFVVRQEHTQSRVVATAIDKAAPPGVRSVVAICPDQLGPSLERELDPARFELLTYPDLAEPTFVDWVDYKDRNARNDPNEFARQILERTGDRPLFLAFREDFVTLEGQCQQVIAALSAQRRPTTLVTAETVRYYEPISVMGFAPPPAK